MIVLEVGDKNMNLQHYVRIERREPNGEWAAEDL